VTPARGPARDGEPVEFHSKGQDWRAVWHPPGSPVPSGRAHGSAAVCFTADGLVAIVSDDAGASWGFPGGRPEAGEDPRATLDREVLEEACATVERALLVGVVRSECVRGTEHGVVLVRSLWIAEVALRPWQPCHETTDRRLVSPAEALDAIRFPPDARPIYERWLQEAVARFGAQR
jgi:8-oxo-dGTP pyrophosphatase MutT (NUDIX family)